MMLRRFRGSMEPLRSSPDYGEREDMNPFARIAAVEKPSTGCLMAVLPDECTALINECGEKIDPKYRILDEEYTENGISERAHVTLKYGICGSSDDVREWCSEKLSPFNVVFTGASVFKNDDSWVLVMLCGKDKVYEYNSELCKTIPHIDPYDKYTPHMTICYMKPGTECDEVLKYCNEKFSGKEYEVSEMEYSDENDKVFNWKLEEK